MKRFFRPVAFILGFVSALMCPPWVPLLLVLIVSIRYRAPEMLLLALFIDTLYLPAGGLPIYTALTALIVWGLEPLRAEIS